MPYTPPIPQPLDNVRAVPCCRDIIGNGSIFASISKEELLNQTFLIPIDSLVEQFNGIAGGIDKKIDILSEQIRLLTEARNRLLPKLMSGELEV